jgi:hypothetical protein
MASFFKVLVELMLPLHCQYYTVIISSSTVDEFDVWDHSVNSV